MREFHHALYRISDQLWWSESSLNLQWITSNIIEKKAYSKYEFYNIYLVIHLKIQICQFVPAGGFHTYKNNYSYFLLQINVVLKGAFYGMPEKVMTSLRRLKGTQSMQLIISLHQKITRAVSSGRRGNCGQVCIVFMWLDMHHPNRSVGKKKNAETHQEDLYTKWKLRRESRWAL